MLRQVVNTITENVGVIQRLYNCSLKHCNECLYMQCISSIISRGLCLGMLQENWRLCIVLVCLDNVALLTSVLGSGNNEFLANKSNAPAQTV